MPHDLKPPENSVVPSVDGKDPTAPRLPSRRSVLSYRAIEELPAERGIAAACVINLKVVALPTSDRSRNGGANHHVVHRVGGPRCAVRRA